MKNFFLFLLCGFLSQNAFSQVKYYQADIFLGPGLLLLDDSTFVVLFERTSHDVAYSDRVICGHYDKRGAILEMKDDSSSYVFSFIKEDSNLIALKAFNFMLKDTLKRENRFKKKNPYFSSSWPIRMPEGCREQPANLMPQGSFSQYEQTALSPDLRNKGYWFKFEKNIFRFYCDEAVLLSGTLLSQNGIITLYDENTGSILKAKLISKTELCVIDFPIRSNRIYYKK